MDSYGREILDQLKLIRKELQDIRSILEPEVRSEVQKDINQSSVIYGNSILQIAKDGVTATVIENTTQAGCKNHQD